MARKHRNQHTRKARREQEPQAAPRSPARELLPLVVLLLGGGLAIAYYMLEPVTMLIEAQNRPELQGSAVRATVPEASPPPAGVRTYRHGENNEYTLWWGPVSPEVRQASHRAEDLSNVRHQDYAGHASCQKCHEENYAAWSKHPHRWMNARAGQQTVKGDFSGDASISYLGGTANFYREGDEFRMRLERDGIERVYRITQTLGSRFFQYYIGTLVAGPEPPTHKFYNEEHVLGFGYWLEKKQWVPTVHLTMEYPDGKRHDPFDPPASGEFYTNYAANCSICHSTYAAGDWMLQRPDLVAANTPDPIHVALTDYLEDSHPEVLADIQDPLRLSDREVMMTMAKVIVLESVPEQAVEFGITCEACHYGAREHAEGKSKAPAFFPASEHISVVSEEGLEFGRSKQNVNFICGRCHSGQRPSYANGISTWNSTEYSDAVRGSCYSQLTCIHCHDPHRGIGPAWTKTRQQDNASCLSCHQEYREPAALRAHTHHEVGSVGSDCMNCHMPRINEGMQDLVRTHTIFSPTDRNMIEQNHPNACNLCHTDWTIDRTVDVLGEWYGASYSASAIAANYPHRDQPVAVGWVKSENEAVRLVGADALIRTESKWALSELVEMLDDPFLINRQFTSKGLEKMLGIRLEDHGYRFYQMPEERAEPLTRIREALLGRKTVAANRE